MQVTGSWGSYRVLRLCPGTSPCLSRCTNSYSGIQAGAVRAVFWPLVSIETSPCGHWCPGRPPPAHSHHSCFYIQLCACHRGLAQTRLLGIITCQPHQMVEPSLWRSWKKFLKKKSNVRNRSAHPEGLWPSSMGPAPLTGYPSSMLRAKFMPTGHS